MGGWWQSAKGTFLRACGFVVTAGRDTPSDGAGWSIPSGPFFGTGHGIVDGIERTGRNTATFMTDGVLGDIADSDSNGETLAAQPAFSGELRFEYRARHREQAWHRL